MVTAALLVVVTASALWIYRHDLRSWYAFRRHFESLRTNAQGYREYRHRQTGIIFVSLPGGTFSMGSPDEEDGRLGEELLETARSVFGEFSDFYPLSNASKTPQQLHTELEHLIDKSRGAPCVVFVDFMGGSCSHACLKLALDHKDVCIVSGVNLPVILAFLNKREAIPFEHLPGEIVERGRNSIRKLDPEHL